VIAAFQRETARERKLELSFALTELTGYRGEGLEPVAPALKELWVATLQQAVGDKQHRIRGMAASHLGVLRDPSVIPLLLSALDDDHAYVRACAALALGRLRAVEGEKKLTTVMEEDWDQTVRSRAREALERIRRP
jgi:HEAT repeat protein